MKQNVSRRKLTEPIGELLVVERLDIEEITEVMMRERKKRRNTR